MSKADESLPAVGNGITPLNGKSIWLKRSAYKAGVLEDIMEKLNERFGVKIAVKTTTGPVDRIAITQISW